MRSVICDRSLNSAEPSVWPRGLRTCDDVAGGGAHVGDVGAINPGMAAAQPLLRRAR